MTAVLLFVLAQSSLTRTQQFRELLRAGVLAGVVSLNIAAVTTALLPITSAGSVHTDLFAPLSE